MDCSWIPWGQIDVRVTYSCNEVKHDITEHHTKEQNHHMDLCAWYFSSQVWCPESLFGWLHRKIPISKTSMEKTKRFWHLTLGFLLTTRCSPISRFWGGDPIRPHPHLHSRGYEIPEEAVQERSYPVHKGLGRNGWNGDIRLLERWIRLGVSMAEKCR